MRRVSSLKHITVSDGINAYRFNFANASAIAELFGAFSFACPRVLLLRLLLRSVGLSDGLSFLLPALEAVSGSSSRRMVRAMRLRAASTSITFTFTTSPAFTSAGINQTRHRILIEVHAGFRILTPFGGEDREIVSTYPVTDTVIVGTVPERYTYIGGSGSDLLGEIRDYDSEK